MTDNDYPHPKPYTTWRHVTTDRLYVVLGTAKCSTNGHEDEWSVIYVSVDYQGMRYRRLSEFMDGRFVHVPAKS